MKKICMLIFLSLMMISLFPGLISQSIDTLDDTGSLSGFIIDEEVNPISGAKVQIVCNDNIFICFSNETGFYYRDDLPIVFCIWNISVYKEGYEQSYHEMSIGINSTYDFILIPITTVELEIEVLSGLHFPKPILRVGNMGSGIAHQVEFSDAIITGNVIYNNRGFVITESLEPGVSQFFNMNSWMIGFGSFSMLVNVTCDEGSFQSDETNGLIFGLFIFIP